MHNRSAFLLIPAFWLACVGTGDETGAAHGSEAKAAEQTDPPQRSDGESNDPPAPDGECDAQAARAFYVQATQVDYDYQSHPPEELLKRSSLVVRGRIVGLGESTPETPLSSEDVETAVELEVEHVYRGTVQRGEPIHVVMSRSPAITAQDLANSARMIPDVSVTLFLVGSKSRPTDFPDGGRVLRPASPQGFLVSSSCGVAQALVSEPLFPADVASTEALHRALLRLVPADPCKSQCPLATIDDSCVERPFESFPRIETTQAEWLETYCTKAEADPSDSFPYLVEARCSDGKRLLYRGTGFSIERRYYTAEGAFLALETGGDGGQGPDCHNSAYWPERIACSDAVVVRVDCGSGTFQVGDSVRL